MSEFSQLREMVDKLRNTSSSKEKKSILSQYPDLKNILRYTYDTFKNYYATSTIIDRNWTQVATSQGPDLFSFKAAKPQGTVYSTLYSLLDDLNDRKISGNSAIQKIQAFILRKENYPYKDLILDIFDRDLKCRVSVAIINSVFPDLVPEFNVALANKFADVEDRVDFTTDTWFASRKLDGVRLLTIIDENGDIKTMSRNGKEFNTLTLLKEEIKEVYPTLRGTVFDGEICIVDDDGNEHFDQIVGLVNRKDYTIGNPKYRVFDILTLKEFLHGTSQETLSSRQKRWTTHQPLLSATRKTDMISPLLQTKISSRVELDVLFDKAVEQEWEGLILRKDATYLGKRSNDLLKVKAFFDGEFIVDSVESGPYSIVQDGKEVVETMMTRCFITYYSEKLKKSNTVGVGSGFTLDQRREIHADNSKLVGKTITIKWFEETINTKTGLPSLRFPTFKCVYDSSQGRTF